MTESIRPIVEAFYRASAVRDIPRIIAMMDDDVDWLVQGPVEIFSFLGQRRGRDAVLAGYREIAQQLDVTGYQVEKLLVDGDCAAALIRLTSIVRATAKVMSIRTSHFSRFRGGKLIEMRAVLDSFDMVEQTLGHPLTGATGESDLMFA